LNAWGNLFFCPEYYVHRELPLWKYLPTALITPGCMRVVLPPKFIDSQCQASTRHLILRYMNHNQNHTWCTFWCHGLFTKAWHVSFVNSIRYEAESWLHDINRAHPCTGNTHFPTFLAFVHQLRLLH
jgi:hypothetical protein